MKLSFQDLCIPCPQIPRSVRLFPNKSYYSFKTIDFYHKKAKHHKMASEEYLLKEYVEKQKMTFFLMGRMNETHIFLDSIKGLQWITSNL